MTCPYVHNQMLNKQSSFSSSGILLWQLCLLLNWVLAWATSQIQRGTANKTYDTRKLGMFLHWGRHIHWLGQNSCNKVCEWEAESLQMLDRSILKELGVILMGEALCILKQVKEATTQTTRVQALAAKSSPPPQTWDDPTTIHEVPNWLGDLY